MKNYKCTVYLTANEELNLPYPHTIIADLKDGLMEYFAPEDFAIRDFVETNRIKFERAKEREGL